MKLYGHSKKIVSDIPRALGRLAANNVSLNLSTSGITKLGNRGDDAGVVSDIVQIRDTGHDINDAADIVGVVAADGRDVTPV